MSDEAPDGARQYIDCLVIAARLGDQPLCLDSGPLIDYIVRQQPVTSLLEPILLSPGVSIVISTITLAEVITRPAIAADTARVQAIRSALLALPKLEIIGVTQAHAVEAAFVHATTGLKLADAAVLAAARLADASALLGNDRLWRSKPLGVPYHHVDDILALA